ncbi:MMPL family transporter [candidate division KSB1 bacterium]|nr:MMPL family transporter [candidate division KSB1 bacterium]NIR69061.1 MMPL family transporter [candidate division KSB1 bacterium]NIS25629.1 MMPL family transporter [candidate division KSB1 bacterium]NIT73979.1 MMPL family transporter [candidate division KSB1 bacterium]NIU26306.1 MMPL family transporter [candidate division KSB1 bacterium]
MLKLADFVIRHRWGIIASVVALTVLFGWQASKVGLNADFSTYLRQDDPLVQEYNRVGDVFGGNAMGYVLVTTDEVFSKENLNLVKKLTDAYEDVDGISYVTSLTNVIDFRRTDWGLEVGKLLNHGEIPQTPEELSALKSYVLNKDRYEGNLVTEDGSTTAIVLRFAGGDNKAISQFATAMRVKAATDIVIPPEKLPTGTNIYYGGMPFLIFNMTLLITDNLMILVPLMVLVLLGILYLGFRHWAGVLFPLLVVLVTDIWVIGLMGMFGLKFDLLSGIMPVVLLALGSADAIHLLKRYFERRRLGESAHDASRRVFKEMGIPIALTTVTTMVGFASLVISDFSVIKQFGLLTALGVLLALVVTLTLLPALLSFGVTPKPVKMKKAKRTHGLDWLAVFVYRHKYGVLIGAAAVVILAVVAIPRIVKDVDWSLCLQKGSAPFHAEMLLREKFGGSLPIQVLIKGDLKDPAVLTMMRNIERRLETVPLVSKSQSIASIIAEMNDVMNDRYVVPERHQGVANLWFLVEGEDMMEQMVANEDKEALLQAKLSTWHTGSLVAAVDSINAYLATLPTKIAEIDLNKIPSSAKREWLLLRKGKILRNLRQDLQKYDIDLGADVLQRVTDVALNFQLKADTRQNIAAAVTDYLRSPEAEAALSEGAMNRVSTLINQNLSQSLPDNPEWIKKIVLETASGVNQDDADWLAQSLVEVIRVQLGKARIAPAIAALRQALPQSSLHNKNLLRDVKGTLWQANENHLYVDAALAAYILPDDNPAMREVAWQFEQTGLPPVLNQMEEELTPTQVESLLTSLIFVIILLAMIHRSLLGGLLAVIPITLTILVNFAVMGILGIGLDAFTAMIASLAIGLGIDTDIHFVSRLRDELQRVGSQLEALKRTLSTTGVSIIINAVAVGLGFVVLLAAGGQHIRRFGGLTALAILLSAVFTLTVLPSLFLWLQPEFLRQETDGSPSSETKTDIRDPQPSEILTPEKKEA